jgi:AraC-like DNA-binding protein
MSQSNDLKVNKLPPHRVDFYTLALNLNTQNLAYTLNNKDFSNPQHFLLCVAPGQIAAWEKKGDWFGYCTFFKSEFLHFPAQVNFLQQYPFFNINETNLLPIDTAHFDMLKPHYEVILQEQQAGLHFHEEIIRSSFQTILWKVRRIYEAVKGSSPVSRANAIIASQFQYLVNQHFLEKITVADYAKMLNVSTNHLSQTISNTVGTSAKAIINKRRLEEAKYLLAYTLHDISEIAYHLRFTEPSHFTKFFKRETGITPQVFRLREVR